MKLTQKEIENIIKKWKEKIPENFGNPNGLHVLYNYDKIIRELVPIQELPQGANVVYDREDGYKE